MNKKIIDKGLFIEGLRQSKGVGITNAVLLSLFAIMIPVLSAVSSFESNNFVRQSLEYYEINTPFVICIFIFAPLYVLTLFHFLNKRSSSDFYHSIPQTRQCLFISYSLAILTWIAAAMAAAALCSAAMSLIFSKYYVINYSSALPMLFNVFSASFMVVSAFLIAMTLTGTVFSNIIVSLLIIFLPRLLLGCSINTIVNSWGVLDSSHFMPLLDNSYNIVVGLVFSVIGLFSADDGVAEALTSPGSGVYTLVVALIYFVIAAVLFKIRKSESADKPAATPKLQSIIRVCVALVFCLPAIALIYRMFNSSDLHSSLVPIIVYYFIAVLAYFIYELITTRRFARLVHIFPGLLVLIVLNAAVIVGMNLVTVSELAFTPSADSIESVSILSDDYYNYYKQKSYFDAVGCNIEFTDSKIKEAVADSLKQTIGGIKKNSSYMYMDNARILNVKIKTAGKTKYRMVVIMNDEYSKKLLPEISRSKEYRDIYLKLPELGKNYTYVNSAESEEFYSDKSLTADQQNKLYETIRDEVANLDFEKWYSLINQGYSENSIGNITATTSVGIKNYLFVLPITPLTEKTYGLFSEYMGELQKQDKQEIVDIMKEQPDYYNQDENSKLRLSFTAVSSDGESLSVEIDKDNAKWFADYLAENVGRQIKAGDAYIKVNYEKRLSDDEMLYDITDKCVGFYVDLSKIPEQMLHSETFDSYEEYIVRQYGSE